MIQRELIDLVDHQNLNAQVDFLQGVNATVEQLARCFWHRLREPIAERARLLGVSLRETENSVATYEEP